MDTRQKARYLRHIGADRPAAEEDSLVARILGGRGGFCYALGGAFVGLPRSLGHGVALLPARVFDDEGWLGPPFDA